MLPGPGGRIMQPRLVCRRRRVTTGPERAIVLLPDGLPAKMRLPEMFASAESDP